MFIRNKHNKSWLIVGILSSNKIFIYIYYTFIYNLQLTDHQWDGCLLAWHAFTNLISRPGRQPGATDVCVKLWYRVLFLHIWEWSKPDREPDDSPPQKDWRGVPVNTQPEGAKNAGICWGSEVYNSAGHRRVKKRLIQESRMNASFRFTSLVGKGHLFLVP